MSTVVRMYDTEENAQAALHLLAEQGFSKSEVFHLIPGDDPSGVIARAVSQGIMPGRYASTCRRALEAGHHVVSVNPPFGKAVKALDAMDRYHPVNTNQLVDYEYSTSGPVLSDMIGWSPITKTGTVITSRVSRGWTLSGTIGIKPLSKRATPLSSLFGMKTLTAPKSKTRSFGLPLLSRRGTVFGFKAIKRESPDRFDSFGIPLLSREPTPLSSMLALKVLLTKDD